MSLRRWLIAAVGVEVALLAGVACDSFSGNDSSVAADAAGGDLDGNGSSLDAKSPVDSSSSMPFMCSAFDAASEQPPSSLKDQTCPGPTGGAGLDLGSNLKNCGWCGHDCLGTTCDKGYCRQEGIAPGARMLGIADGKLVYHTASLDVLAFPLGTSLDASTLLGTIPDAEVNRSIEHAAFDDRVYVRTYLQLYTAPLTGGGLALFHGPVGTPGMVATGAGHVFETPGSNDTLYDYQTDGSYVTSVSGMPGAMDITVTPDGKYVFYVARFAADAGFDAATDASTYQSRGSIYRYDVSAKQAVHLIDADWRGERPSQLIVADQDFLYYAEAVSGDIKRIPVNAAFPATATLISAGKGRNVRSFTMDAERLYWFQNNDASVFYTLHSTSKCGGGGEREHTGSGVFVPYPMIIDGPYIYFTTGNTDVIRLAK